MNVIIFTRVSTVDKQDYSRQVNELNDYCKNNNWNVVETITEKMSGKTVSRKRPAIQKLFTLISKHRVKKVVVSEVSRFGRNTVESLQDIEKLKEHNVSLNIMNYKLDTLNDDGTVNSMGQFLITLLLDIGRMERETTIERIKSGLAEAKRKGKTLGRPKGTTKENKDILSQYSKLVASISSTDLSIRKLAKLHDVSINTVQKVKRAMAA